MYVCIYILSCRYWEILQIGYSVATSLKDEWHAVSNSLYFPGIGAIISLSNHACFCLLLPSNTLLFKLSS